jgi:hypothetical protein
MKNQLMKKQYLIALCLLLGLNIQATQAGNFGTKKIDGAEIVAQGQEYTIEIKYNCFYGSETCADIDLIDDSTGKKIGALDDGVGSLTYTSDRESFRAHAETGLVFRTFKLPSFSVSARSAQYCILEISLQYQFIGTRVNKYEYACTG